MIAAPLSHSSIARDSQHAEDVYLSTVLAAAGHRRRHIHIKHLFSACSLQGQSLPYRHRPSTEVEGGAADVNVRQWRQSYANISTLAARVRPTIWDGTTALMVSVHTDTVHVGPGGSDDGCVDTLPL